MISALKSLLPHRLATNPSLFYRGSHLRGSELALVGFVLLLGVMGGLASGIGFYVVDAVILLPTLLIVVVLATDSRFFARVLPILGWVCFIALVLWPRYSYIRVGGLPAITPARLSLALWLGAWLAFWVKSANFRLDAKDWRQSSGAIGWSFAFLVCWRLFSNLFSNHPLAAFFLLSNEALMSWGVFLFFGATLRDRSFIPTLVKVFAVLVVITVGLGTVEFWIKRNLFAGILPVTDDYAASALLSKVRDAGYRAQSTFDHPLTFAQFLVVSIPLLFSGLLSAKGIVRRSLWCLTILAALIGVVETSTRSAIAVSIIAGIMFWGIVSFRRMIAGKVLISHVLWGLVAAIVLLLCAYVVSDKLAVLVAGRSSAEASSSMARLLMFQRAIPLVIDSPLVGYGAGRAAELVGVPGAGGLLSIDSLLISFAVESGLATLVAYMALVVFAVIRAIKASALNDDYAYFGAGLASAIAAFFLTTITLSLTANLFVLAILLAAVVAIEREEAAA